MVNAGGAWLIRRTDRPQECAPRCSFIHAVCPGRWAIRCPRRDTLHIFRMDAGRRPCGPPKDLGGRAGGSAALAAGDKLRQRFGLYPLETPAVNGANSKNRFGVEPGFCLTG